MIQLTDAVRPEAIDLKEPLREETPHGYIAFQDSGGSTVYVDKNDDILIDITDHAPAGRTFHVVFFVGSDGPGASPWRAGTLETPPPGYGDYNWGWRFCRSSHPEYLAESNIPTPRNPDEPL